MCSSDLADVKEPEVTRAVESTPEGRTERLFITDIRADAALYLVRSAMVLFGVARVVRSVWASFA